MMTLVDMKAIAAFGFIVLLGLASGAPADDDHYTTKYDNVNVQEILNNPRVFDKYFNCLMETGKCTPDGKELKDILPEALETGCAKCNEKQRQEAEKVIKHMIDKMPEKWEALKTKFDPQNKYAKKYEKEAKEHGIKV